MKSFAKILLDSSRAARCVGPNSSQAFCGENVGDAAAERQLGTDDREIDFFATRNRFDGMRVSGIDGNAARETADAGISGRTHDVRHGAF